MATRTTCGEALVRLLEQYGVDTVFGIPGVHTLDLYRGIANSNVRHVLARNEQGAGFMADGYARVSRKAGVCTLITGPGVTNAATPLGQAYIDSIPVLLISSVNATHTLGKGWGCLHEITDQRAVTAPLTAMSATAFKPEDVPEFLGQAFALFQSSRPRPVHIAVPIDVLAQSTSGEWSARLAPARPGPDLAAVRAGASLPELAELLGATVIASNAGKGIVPDSHPLSLGTSLMLAGTRSHLAQADVVLAIGTELSETDSFIDRLDINGKLIRVDIDAGRTNDLYPATIGIQADAAATVNALLSALKETGASPKQNDLDAVREQNNAKFSPVEQQHRRLLASLRNTLATDAVVMGDITQLVYTGTFAFPAEQPRCWYYPAGYCTLGCALPMAIGAKLAAPDRDVVVLVGDGGFMFTIQELATAAQLKQPLPIVIWSNSMLQQIHDNMVEWGIPPTGVDLTNPDFVMLANAFGCHGTRPDSLDAFETAVDEALRAQTPTLIEVQQGADWLT
jgi:5-guanidino-2-oxopentanoate decarboxylase